MKCFEIRKCSEEDRKACFVYLSYENKDDLENVKCWVMNGAFQQGNKEQLAKCLACPYYKEQHKESGISMADKTGTTIIAVSGAINNDRAKSLEKVHETLLEKHRYRVILNLAGVNNIYSCGLGIIIRMHKDMNGKGGFLYITNCQTYVKSIFDSTKLNRFLTLYNSEEEAIQTLEDKLRGEQEAKQRAAAQAAQAKELEARKSMRCWEYWNNHNPKNANTCDECYRKQTQATQPCWLVEGSVEGVSFQYVNEDCEDCEYYILKQSNA